MKVFIVNKILATFFPLLMLGLIPLTAVQAKELARHDFPYESHYVDVLGSKMHYVDTGGEGSTLVMIHGQPTWSYLWRNIIPQLEEIHRVIALDLIGLVANQLVGISPCEQSSQNSQLVF